MRHRTCCNLLDRQPQSYTRHSGTPMFVQSCGSARGQLHRSNCCVAHSVSKARQPAVSCCCCCSGCDRLCFILVPSETVSGSTLFTRHLYWEVGLTGGHVLTHLYKYLVTLVLLRCTVAVALPKASRASHMHRLCTESRGAFPSQSAVGSSMTVRCDAVPAL